MIEMFILLICAFDILHYVFVIYVEYRYYKLTGLGPEGPTKTHRPEGLIELYPRVATELCMVIWGTH